MRAPDCYLCYRITKPIANLNCIYLYFFGKPISVYYFCGNREVCRPATCVEVRAWPGWNRRRIDRIPCPQESWSRTLPGDAQPDIRPLRNTGALRQLIAQSTAKVNESIVHAGRLARRRIEYRRMYTDKDTCTHASNTEIQTWSKARRKTNLRLPSSA